MEAALIGLSQSGKSTLFSAIAEGHVHAGAGLSHQADKAVVTVPDERVEALNKVFQRRRAVHATIDFLDLPGLSFSFDATVKRCRPRKL